jgi:malonyl-CoA O-methyltransferase
MSEKVDPKIPFKSPYLPENPKIVGVQEGYDLWSEIYDEEANALIQLEEMHLFPLLQQGNYKNIFDCGCGTGRLALWLRGRFPEAEVTGADFSQGMLARARAKSVGQKINWHDADLNRPFPFAEGGFDLVVSSLVVEHIQSLENYFAGIRQVAMPGGDIFISGLHPAMHFMGISARFKSKENDAHIMPESCCHSMATVFNAAVGAGLRVVRIEEHPVDDRLIKICEKARRYEGLPLLFFMKMTRV